MSGLPGVGGPAGWERWAPRARPPATVVALAALLVAVPAWAQRSLVISSFDADIAVQADGTIEVTETIRPTFAGAWNGIYRDIPVEYRTPQGFNFTLRLELVGITDDHGTALKYETGRERHYRRFKIWVPGAVNATRTVLIRYRVRNALGFFDEHDELYWNVTGDEWQVPIEASTARLMLPRGVENVRALAFTGGYGSRESLALLEVSGSEVHVQTAQALNFREGLTVVVSWNPGVVRRPSAMAASYDFVRSNLAFLIPLVALVIMWRLWATRGRDPRRRPITVQYEPPSRLTPGLIGTLVDNKPDMRDITATLVDLAVRGFLLIEEQEERKLLGLWTSRDYVLTIRKDETAWTELEPHERALLDGLARRAETTQAGEEAGRPRVAISKLKNEFYKELPAIRDALYDWLVSQGYYVSRPDKVKARYLVSGIVPVVLVVVAGLMWVERFGIAPQSVVVAGVLTGLIVGGFALIMPARTSAGARAVEGALGFEEFLRRVESDRFERIVKTPELFEKYLPYAMALGVEETWARAFEGICQRPPDWYRGHGVPTFRTSSFVSDLGRMSTAAAATMASAPRSAGGSGFGGGGFSGGGVGGGGGGGF